MQSNPRFRRISGVFTCEYCGQRTRYIDSQSHSSRTCQECYDNLMGLESMLRDDDEKSIAELENTPEPW